MSWRKPNTAPSPPWPDRPDGELLWFHATTAERYLALCDIGLRLKSLRPDLHNVVTSPLDLDDIPIPDGCDIAIGDLPTDQPAEVRGFLDHWHPDLCLWAGGDLRPTLLRQVKQRGIESLLVDVLPTELPERKSRWLPDQNRKTLDIFSAILTPSKAALDHLLKLGIDPSNLQVTGALRISASPPSCHEDELHRMQTVLCSRPVWLAAHACLSELPMILTAHRGALRRLHRLLLVLSTRSFDELDAAREALRASGLRFADWEIGEEPDDNTQVLLSCDEEIGLWLRVAPLCLLGGTFATGGDSRNPMDAAALGSAILYGPSVGNNAPLYNKLSTGGAAAQIASPDDLTSEVITYSAPDKAAEMALAGWQIVTEGAEMADKLLDILQDMLDQRERRHAGT